MLAGLSDASALDPVALGGAIDAVQVIKSESERLWDLLKDQAMKSEADGWIAKPDVNRLYRTVSARNRVSLPIHLRKDAK